MAVASPWTNGAVERVNRFLKSTLAKMVDENNDWMNVLSVAQHVINNTLNKAIGTTPSKLLLGYDQRVGQDRDLRDIIENLQEMDKNFDADRAEARDLAQIVSVVSYKNTIRSIMISATKNV